MSEYSCDDCSDNCSEIVNSLCYKGLLADYKQLQAKLDGFESGVLEPLQEKYKQVRGEVEQLQAELIEWKEKEASVCLEDVGFVEYIKHLRAELDKRIINNLVSIDRIHSLQDEIRRLQAENKKLAELAKRRSDLLVCYRIGKQPSETLLNRLDVLRKFEEALKEN